jgi:hypothetical protein
LGALNPIAHIFLLEHLLILALLSVLKIKDELAELFMLWLIP